MNPADYFHLDETVQPFMAPRTERALCGYPLADGDDPDGPTCPACARLAARRDKPQAEVTS